MLRLKKNHTSLKMLRKTNSPEDVYVKASPGELVSFVWELTAELWSLKEPRSAERRLQRNVTRLVKQQG
jgi:hypothetical protein